MLLEIVVSVRAIFTGMAEEAVVMAEEAVVMAEEAVVMAEEAVVNSKSSKTMKQKKITSADYALEQPVRKVGGSYQADGTIKAIFQADDGSWRYVFRFNDPPGLLHIFGGSQLSAK